MNRLRLLPIVLVAVTALFALKTLGIMFRGGYLFEPVSVAQAQTETGDAAPSQGAQEAAGAADAHAGDNNQLPGGAVIDGRVEDSARQVHPGEEAVGAKAAILERLTERRQELDERARQLDMREQLLKATEKRVEERITALEQVESRIVGVEQEKAEEKKAKLEGLITMYENMKAKDAARIFNQLDLNVLVDLVEQMNARNMAAILAEMDSDAAERLTLAIAARARTGGGSVVSMKDEEAGGELPKIEGTRAN